MFKIPLKYTVLKYKKEIWDYNKANYNEICQHLESVQWDSIVEGKDVEQEWFTIKGELLKCMHELVPKKRGDKQKAATLGAEKNQEIDKKKKQGVENL